MARIELSNIGGGGGTTLSLTTTGTSGASTLAGSVLNIPVYQGQLTLTTTGTSGAATLSGDILNIPQYSGGGTPAGSAGQVQFNSTPAGSFAASANLAWDNTAVQLNINTPLSPTGKLNVKGSGATSSTVNTRLTDSGNTELLKVLDNGSTNIGANFNWDNVNGRLGLGTSTPNQTLEVSGAMRLTGTAGTAAFMLGRNSAGDVSTVTLGTTGTSGAATLSANVLNIPQYQGALTLTTTGTSGAATLSGSTLNIPIYSGGASPGGSTGQIQFNNAGAFGASANLFWDNTNARLNLGVPATAPSRLNIKGYGTLNSTSSLRIENTSGFELFRIADNGELTTGNGTTAQINISASAGGGGGTAARMFIYPTTNSTPELVIRPFGTSSDMPGLLLGDSQTGATNSNNFLLGRGGSTLPSAGVTYIGNTVANNLNANSFHLGFLVSAVALARFEAQRIFSSGNIIMQNGGTYTDNGYKLDIISASSTHALRTRAPNASSGTNALLVQNTTVSDLYKIEADGKISYWATNTAAGTTGAQTINRPSGTVNFAAGATSLVVTNSLCTTASIVLPVIRTNDATAQIKNVVPAAGSFTINLSAAATSETSVGFFIIN